ncbi:hypothetical protein I7I51_03507 [Histoplasma capsulatum]|uniref:Uncharacterized protein n=1 Tax=Ajellomyces capsulatus TaxID=5037 RepID=A0A8A1M9N6_AJECA|nr:hypothetical protein I7I51_03507 [Histoplasma capsulatum]
MSDILWGYVTGEIGAINFIGILQQATYMLPWINDNSAQQNSQMSHNYPALMRQVGELQFLEQRASGNGREVRRVPFDQVSEQLGKRASQDVAHIPKQFPNQCRAILEFSLRLGRPSESTPALTLAGLGRHTTVSLAPPHPGPLPGFQTPAHLSITQLASRVAGQVKRVQMA